MRSHACVCAHLCLILCDPKDSSPPGFLSMGFPRQEYWSGLPVPLPGDLSESETEPASLISCIVGGFFATEPPGKPPTLRSCDWVLIQYDWCPCKKMNFGYRQVEKEDHVKTFGNTAIYKPERLQKKPVLPTP